MPNENFSVPLVRSLVAGYGLATPFGTLLPPGGQVAAFVRSTGIQNGDDAAIGANWVSTLASALERVRAGFGDTIYVLPGHTENVTDATMLNSLKTGTKIIGVGRGSNMPTFRWTAAASSWTLNDADVVLSGLRLRIEGFNGVTAGIVVSAADVLINNCDIETSSGVSNKATTAIRVDAGGDRFEFVANRIRGLAAGATTDVFAVNGAVDSLRVTDNEIIAPAAVGNGVLRFVAGASTNLFVARNFLYNNFAASTTALNVGAAVDGVVADNRLAVIAEVAAGVSAGSAFVITAGTVKCFENYWVDVGGARTGTIVPATPAA